MNTRTVTLGQTLWEPTSEYLANLNLTAFADHVSQHHDLDLSTYADLWRWSIDDIDAFWRSIVEFYDIQLDGDVEPVRSPAPMPRTAWFPGARVNYAEHALRGDGTALALMIVSSDGDREMTLDQLRDEVARVAQGLRSRGVTRGDAVAAYLPSGVEAVALLLACASIGAVFTSCTIEFGAPLVIDRLSVLRPTVLVAADGYRYHEKVIDRRPVIEEIAAGLPSVEHLVTVPQLFAAGGDGTETWDDLRAEPAELRFESLPFDHPLYVLYSSGTTGRPKAFVHAHGRMLVEHVKALGLHLDLSPGDRLLQPTTTSWMLWNLGVSALLVGAVPVFYEGDPLYPDPLEIWRAASRSRATVLNCGAGVVTATMRSGLRPGDELDLSALRTVSVTGSPFPPEGFAWVYDAVKPDVFVASGSGGTDLCTGVVGGIPSLPVTAGEMSAGYLGAAIDSFDADGRPVRDADGELVITRPMPSMPVALADDADFERYEASYFGVFDGVWCHGDWIKIRPTGEAVITGRSDATLNRGGVRIGTSEIYTLMERVPHIQDCVIVHLDDGANDRLVMIVTATEEDEELESQVRAMIRRDLSPRHVPDRVFVVGSLPRTLTGKRLEIPVKRILSGATPSDVLDPAAITNADALPALVEVSEHLASNATPSSPTES